MKEFKASFMVWKMAIAKASLVAVISGITVFQTAMSGGVKWENLAGTDRALVLLGIVAAMATSIVAFLDRTIARIEKGLPTFTDLSGDTTIITKSSVTTEQTTNSPGTATKEK